MLNYIQVGMKNPVYFLKMNSVFLRKVLLKFIRLRSLYVNYIDIHYKENKHNIHYKGILLLYITYI